MEKKKVFEAKEMESRLEMSGWEAHDPSDHTLRMTYGLDI